MSVNPIRRGRNGAAVAKLVLGAILLLLNGCTAFSQIRTGSEETLQRRMNVTACEYGLSGCNESRLTPAEAAQVGVTRRRMNALVPEYEPQSQPARSVLVARPSIVPAGSPATLAVAENGSYYGELNKNGVPKTVHVDGYFRSNGTYVRGYYRSAPGTNP